jgi:hypothetical protein
VLGASLVVSEQVSGTDFNFASARSTGVRDRPDLSYGTGRMPLPVIVGPDHVSGSPEDASLRVMWSAVPKEDFTSRIEPTILSHRD